MSRHLLITANRQLSLDSWHLIDYPPHSFCAEELLIQPQGRNGPMTATDRIGWRVRRITAVLVGMLLCGVVSLAQTVPPKIIVEDVVPQGNRTVPSQKIIGLIKTRPGNEYLQETI